MIVGPSSTFAWVFTRGAVACDDKFRHLQELWQVRDGRLADY